MDILIAEDQPVSALILRRLLERLGHRVTVAADGIEAWKLVNEHPFRLVISDWIMPGMDGPELCRRVRARQGAPYTYLILLTSKHRQSERLEGLRAGADDFLVKPPDSEELAVRLEIARRILDVQEELERRNLQLAALASSDELTGLHNRRRFREILDLCCARASRTGSPVSLMMVDVDHFKAFNDAHGHPAGDDALRAVAGLLRAGVREYDEVARVGGEEFSILLPDADSGLSRELAGRLRGLFASKSWPVARLTASFGVATSSAGEAGPSTLIDRADRALYESKRRGRDRATHFLDLDLDPDAGPVNG